MKWLPKDMGGFFYDDIDYQGIIYWFHVVKLKIEDESEYKKLILKGLGFKNAS